MRAAANHLQNQADQHQLLDTAEMPAAWKTAGLTYNRYLAVAARAMRRSLKEQHRVAAERRGEMDLRFAKWSNGKQGEVKDLGSANTAAMAESASS
ncbi:hypothetical protein E4U30_007224 [Claviceps sp. LM220 group G6]|nr:hypothetical protein E4U15_004284 [Claviceps sp. LM218 group G6]KAG6102297.1 hypothetical protein E4U30_007224 [Claviceps sp. LM220 group G6]KAG6107165.1 hypothetical protein E4U31_000292 [Claviceps sp. LM219 group G6]